MKKKLVVYKPVRDIEVITTHINADFDALASMLAVAKLYPRAWLVIPGAQERNLRNFFVESTCSFYNFVKLKKIPFNRVKRLILVDTRQKDRLGSLGKLVDHSQVDIHVYDHHPDTSDDVVPSYQLVLQVGATVTVLTQVLRDECIKLTGAEATLLALGIFEDTGNFSFISTTPDDFEAAGWLLSQGANLLVVSSLIVHEMTTKEVILLNDLIHSANKITINGVEIVICEINQELYVPELAVSVHKFMDIDNLGVLFTLARMEERIYLVARSRLSKVDVGIIAKAFGGGGHSTAASATVRNFDVLEIKKKILILLSQQITPCCKASDLMTRPVVYLRTRTTIGKANDMLARYNINAFPVVKENEIKGIISCQIIKKAMLHGLKKLSVSEYMDPWILPIEISTALYEIERVVVEYHQYLVLVMDCEQLVGVITRTDLLNVLIKDSYLHEFGQDDRIRYQINIFCLIRQYIPHSIINILFKMSIWADALNYGIYLVGGSVRDIFLQRSILDIDVVVEGNGIFFARLLAQDFFNVRVYTYKQFKTARIVLSSKYIIDIASARLEYYKAPAALPIVKNASIKLDLYRRDFTINTLAICIDTRRFGILYDFFDGISDLKEGTVRVLHNLSFVEDPTRIFRAVRFEQRFGFCMDWLTENLVKNAIKINVFKYFTGKRLFSELIKIFEEKQVINCLSRLRKLKLLPMFHTKLKLETNDLLVFKQVQRSLTWFRFSFPDYPLHPWLVMFLGFTSSLNIQNFEAIVSRLDLDPSLKKEIIEMRMLALISLNSLQRNFILPSMIYFLLNPLKIEYQIYIMGKTVIQAVKEAISYYLTRLCKVHPKLRGKDVKIMGYTSWPLLKAVLDRLQVAYLFDEIVDQEQEIKLVQAEFSFNLEKNT